jgi:hypothetical protein
MAATFKSSYPSSSSVALTLGVASLASDTSLLAGRESNAVDNTSNLDLDHLVSGVITTGTTPTVNTTIEVWAYASYKTASGTPTYPDVFDGTDSNETVTNSGIKASALRLVASIIVTATSNVAYPFAPVSIASLFGAMPKFWGLFVVHNTGAALNSTAGNHDFQYERIQAQSV